MSSRRRERLRMDNRAGRPRASSPPSKPELDKVMKKARSRDATNQRSYWNKKLLEAEEKDPNRWRHSGYKELYGGSPARSRSRSRATKPRRRPRTPPPAAKTARASSSRSLSSCSDESCSVCSPRGRRSRSFSVPRAPPAAAARAPSPRAAAPRAPAPRAPVVRAAAPRRRRQSTSPPRDPRPKPTPKPPKRVAKKKAVRPSSPASSSSSSSPEPTPGPARMTLSERFGKMAQWTVDRRDLEGVNNMRITKHDAGSDLQVVLQERPGMPVSDRRTGAGFYPESLHTGPTGLEAWDDVRVRYQYYKARGYLRDLTLQDYIKWEEWWYQYQEWLENERCYEQWQQLRYQPANKPFRGKRRGRRHPL